MQVIIANKPGWARRWLQVAGYLVAITIGTALMTPAHAADASGPGVQAVNLKFNQIGDTLRAQYYVNKSNPVPQWTPSGGVFQYFTGGWGEGAIYWWPGAYYGASVIYGDILRYFRAQNFENTLGYPYTDELPGNTAGPCGTSVLREQWFSNQYVVCWNYSRTWKVKVY